MIALAGEAARRPRAAEVEGSSAGVATRHNARMNIVILDDYQDAVRKLACAAKLEPYPAKVYTNPVKGLGQLAVRLRDAEVLVLIRERTHIPRAPSFLPWPTCSACTCGCSMPRRASSSWKIWRA